MDAQKLRTKKSNETGEELYGSKSINDAYKSQFKKRGWKSIAFGFGNGVTMEDKIEEGYWAASLCKNGMGVSMEFGRNGGFGGIGIILSLMAFFQFGAMKCCAVIVPSASFSKKMPSGVDNFEDVKKSFGEHRSLKNNMPLLILGVDV